MNSTKNSGGNRAAAIIVFIIITLCVPVFLYFINVILSGICSFLNTHLPSALVTVLSFLLDGDEIAGTIINPLITAVVLYFLVDVDEKICPSREGLRYLCGIILSVIMLILEFRYFIKTSTDDTTASIAMSVLVSQGIYIIMLARLFHTKGTLAMVLKGLFGGKNIVVFMGGDNLDRIKGYAVAKCRKPIIDSKGQIDSITLRNMAGAVQLSDTAFQLAEYRFAFPCRIEGVNAVYKCYVELKKRSKWGVDYDEEIHYLPNGQEGSFPLEIVNTLKTVKYNR